MSESSVVVADSRSWRRINSRLIAGLVALAFVIWPVYVLPPGYPQPVTLIFLLAFLGLFARDSAATIGLFRGQELSLITAFLGYALVVNLVVSIANQDFVPLRHPLFYLQVVIGCAAFQYVLRTEPLAPRIIYAAVLGALMLQFVALMLTATTAGTRQTLMYANPNQLGFFALLALSYLLLLHQRGAGSAASLVPGAAIALFLVLLSLSKAAIFSAFVLFALYGLFAPIRGPRLRRLRPLLMAVVPGLLIGLAIAYRDEVQIFSAVADRMENIGEQSDDSMAGRGYGRILLWPQYLIFGAGEGLLGRWESPREIHSMIGTLLFSYGLPGTFLVLSLFAIVYRRNRRDFIIYMTPILVYSLTHHPMRQTMMWTLLLLIVHQPSTRIRSGIG